MTDAKPLDLLLVDLVGSLGHLNCRGAVPTAGGDLALAFDGPDGPRGAVLNCRSQPAAGRLVEDVGDLFVHGKDSDPSAAGWLRSVAGLLVSIRDGGPGAWLDIHNRELGSLDPSPSGLWMCLAWLIEPGRPFYRGWKLADVAFLGRDRPGLRLSLKRDDPVSDEVRMVLDPGVDPHEGEVPVASTPLGLLSREESGRTPDVKRRGRSPEAALAFVLSLSVPPGLKWAGPPVEPPPDPEAGGEAPRRDDDSLIVHSFRTDHEWHLPRSRFFNTWGDRDWFILLALWDKPNTIVFHGNRECQVVRQSLSDRFGHGSNPLIPRQSALSWMVHELHCTDTDDQNAVFGGEDRLEGLLDGLSARDPQREVRVLFGCDTEMVGDDVPRVCRMARESGQDVECFNPPLPRFTDTLARNWWLVFLNARDRAVTPDPSTVNLAGFLWPGDPVLGEIEGMLDDSGVRVATRMFPGQRPDIPSSVGRAAVTVTSPWHPVQDVLVEALKAEGLPSAALAMPYGESPTRLWLDAVRSLVNLPAIDDDVWRKTVDRLAPDLGGLRKRASGLRVALVADWGTVPEMVSPAFFFGLEPVRLLLDLGFGVDLVGRGTDEARSGIEELSGVTEDMIRYHEMDPLNEDPVEFLRELSPDLVYCDRDGAAAASEAGVTPFGIDDLEPGLPGAQRTSRRLIARAGLRLHQRYARWL